MESISHDPAREGPSAAGGASPLERSMLAQGRFLLRYVERQLPADLREHHDPQDVVQDVYFEAFRRADTFRGTSDEECRNWLATIAYHRVVRLIRIHRALKRGGGKAQEGQAGHHDSLIAMLEELAVYSRTPSRSAAAREFMAALEGALERLPTQYAEVIRLRHIEGEPIKAVAERLGKTEASVNMLCSRGMAALRAELRSASLFV